MRDGVFERIKARICVGGSRQVEGKDYSISYTPVASATTFRPLFAITVMRDRPLPQLDITTAFLNGDLTEQV